MRIPRGNGINWRTVLLNLLKKKEGNKMTKL